MALGSIAFDSKSDLLYMIAYYRNNSVGLVSFDPTSNILINSIPIGYTIGNIVYDPLNNNLYYPGNGTLWVVDGSSGRVIGHVGNFASPAQVVIDPANGELFVSDLSAGVVAVINGTTNTVVKNITGLNQPLNFAYDGENGNVYVTTGGMNSSLAVINSSTNTLTTDIKLPIYDTQSLTYDGANGEIYLSGYVYGSNQVTVVNGSDNRVLNATISLPTGPVLNLAFNPNDQNVYVASNTTGVNLPGDLSIINSAANTAQTPITGMGAQPSSFAYDSENRVLYLTSLSDTLFAIRTSTSSISCSCPTEPSYHAIFSNPYLVSTPGNNTLYVTFNITISSKAYVYSNWTLGSLTLFQGNPEWQKLGNGSWIPTNSSVINESALWAPFARGALNVTTQAVEVQPNTSTRFLFKLDVANTLPGYYGLVLGAYVEFSCYPAFPIVYTGYIPLEVK